MPHLRQQILDAIRARLAPVAEQCGAIVSPIRSMPVPEEDLPSFTVLYTSDQSTPDGIVFDAESSMEVTRLNHRLSVNVVIHFKGRKDPSKEFDELAAAVETALPPSTLDGLIIDMVLTSTDHFIDAGTALTLGAGRLVFDVIYRTYAGQPDKAA